MSFYMLQPMKNLQIGNSEVGNYPPLFVVSSKGKIKEYTYQKQYAAENKVNQLMADKSEFIVCTDSELQFITPNSTDEFDYD